MSKWDYLFEGTPIQPTASMEEAAKTITDRAIDIIIRAVRHYRPSSVSPIANIGELNQALITGIIQTLNENLSTALITSPYHDDIMRVRLVWTVGMTHKDLLGTPMIGAVTVPSDIRAIEADFLNTTIDDPRVAMSSVYKDTHDAVVTFQLHFNDIVPLVLPAFSGYFNNKAIAKYSSHNAKAAIYRIVLHELVHVVDPKYSNQFMTQEYFRRTRHPYPIDNSQDSIYNVDRYIKHQAERETWPRDIARIYVVEVWLKSNGNKQAVERSIRNPDSSVLADHPYQAINQVTGENVNPIDVFRSSKLYWRRFLRTLIQEKDKLFEDPKAYIEYTYVATPEAKKDRAEFTRKLMRTMKIQNKVRDVAMRAKTILLRFRNRQQ